MIIVPIKEGENIERALKKFKRKFEKTGAVRELRSRKNFAKPSEKKRIAHGRAVILAFPHIDVRPAVAGHFFTRVCCNW